MCVCLCVLDYEYVCVCPTKLVNCINSAYNRLAVRSVTKPRMYLNTNHSTNNRSVLCFIHVQKNVDRSSGSMGKKLSCHYIVTLVVNDYVNKHGFVST